MKKLTILGLSMVAVFSLFASKALAQDVFGTNNLSNISVATTRDLTGMIVGIVNIVLGFLGVIAVLLFLYAGFLWLSSRGNVQQIQKAKMVMASAVIGLLIIFASYAIANFVITKLGEATGVSNTNTTPGGPTVVTCPEPTGAALGTPLVCSLNPTGGPVGSYLTIYGWNFGDFQDTSISTVSFGATLAELVTCNSEEIWDRLYTTTNGNSYYVITVIVPNLAIDTSYSVTISNNPINFTAGTFHITSGGAGLNIACLRPSSGVAGFNGVIAEGINFGTTVGNLSMPGWDIAGDVATTLNIAVPPADWTDTNITFNIPANALSGNVIVSNTAGTESDQSPFTVTCSDNIQCSSECCSWGECREANICAVGTTVPAGPYIQSIVPNNGAEGSIVTIVGSGFGVFGPASRVFFNSASGPLPADTSICAANYWYDNYIIVGVPVGATDGAVFVLTDDGQTSNNNVTFDVNSVTRPGLCSISPTTGRFETTLVTATGINFEANDQMLYGGIPGYNIAIAPPNSAQSNVPNLQPGTVSVQIRNTISNESSNPIPFTVDNSLFGDPTISEISPASGPEGEYITVLGANFGNTPGELLFDATNADFDFPIWCRTSYWTNSQIIAKVPNFPGTGAGTYAVTVHRPDLKVSAPINFTINTDPLSPGLCAIYPDNGPNNYSPVDIFGERLGTAPGQVIFHNAAPISTINWTDEQITSLTVPADAESGAVSVTNSAGVPSSNQLYFRVSSCDPDSTTDCPSGQQCCEDTLGNYCAASCSSTNSCDYTWNIHTENNPFGIFYNYDCNTGIQSPSPWPDGLQSHDSQDFFPNAMLSVTFTRNVVDSDLTNPLNFRLFQCTDRNVNCNTEISGTATIKNLGSNNEGIIFDPSVDDLQPGTWYQVRFGTFRATGSGDIWNISYDTPLQMVGGWNFKTRDGSGACIINNISVDPQSPAADFYVGSNRSFIAVPQAVNCNICGGTYTWNWQLTTNPAAASFVPAAATSNTGNFGLVTLHGESTTENLAPDNHITLEASVVQGSLTYTASTDPVIKSPVLLVENYGPICDDSCLTGSVWIDFNTEVDGAYLNRDHFSIRDCGTDPTCSTPGANIVPAGLGGVWQDNINFIVNLGHNPAFQSDHYYQVGVDTNIRNVAGYILSPPYTGWTGWIFKTGDQDCTIDNVTLEPGLSNVVIGDVVSYGAQAFSPANLCYPGGQPLDCSAVNACSWSWQATDITGVNVASIPPANSPINEATAISIGQSRITATTNQATGNHSASGLLNVNEGPPIVTHSAPTVVSYSPPANSTDMCPNLAVEIIFSELMNPDSIRENVGIYERRRFPPGSNLSTTIECIYSTECILADAGHYWGKIEENFVITDFDSADADTLPDQTRVIINPNQILNPPEAPIPPAVTPVPNYRVVVKDTVTSKYGVSLSLPPEPAIELFATIGTINSFSWVFTTGEDACRISFLEVINNEDWFTCAKDTGCTGDVNLGLNGNQHNYTAIARDFRNVVLNPGIGFGIIWSLNNDSTDFLTLSGTTGPTVQGTVINQNGQETLTALAADNNSNDGFDYGSVSASSWISIFLCENPWPSLNSFPWQDAAFGIGSPPFYNFSTYYCYDSGIAGDPILPQLNQPVANPNHPANVLKEFIFPVAPPVAIKASENFGSLALGNPASQWLKDLSHLLHINPAQGQTTGTDVIAVRVMANSNHLSVVDWFKQNAPNPNQTGESIEVDGYPALRVGNTVYISAVNLSDAPAAMFTNIYMLAYNIGARESTQEIFEQLVDNFKLNINLGTTYNDNLCNGTSNTCSSDFDCANHNCRSRGLKLRRDLKRLGDLYNVRNLLLSYGEDHMACSNNSQIACTMASQCPSAAPCVPYYPLLNAGTFIQGKSNSKWPSWQQTLGENFGSDLPTDPINLFNGCSGAGYDPNTCWNEEALSFSCPVGSLIYNYNRVGTGTSFALAANFEYDTNPWLAGGVPVTFASSLANIDSRIQTSLAATCTAASANLSNPHCGDGIIDLLLGEICDGGYRDNLCTNSSDPILAGHNWWNEQRAGCYPPGSIVGGALVECTWYQPILNAQICGGYCGNNRLEPQYERCEIVSGVARYNNIEYSCPNGPTALRCSSVCQPVCIGTVTTPAAACGDGVWTPNVEQCDSSASPNGLDAWDCTVGGNTSCDNTCHVQCDADASTPYIGSCGDGTHQAAEECDYASYASPIPDNATSLANPYTCAQDCTLGSDYCGDTRIQTSFQEVCDTTLSTSTRPSPASSSRYSQYQCRMVSGVATDARWTRCTPTDGGYCGDSVVQSIYGEICEPWSLGYHPQPSETSPTNQYSCTSNCLTMTGGWCGDGTVQNGTGGTGAFGEMCDPGRFIPPVPALTDIDHQYACSDNCSQDLGGYCGDSIVQNGTDGTQDYGELCDIASYPRPGVGQSSINRQYQCNACAFDNEYCGNGSIEAPYYVCVIIDGSNNWQTLSADTQATCEAAGGKWRPIEECDVGIIPTQKQVELVFVFDMSRSMDGPAGDLCAALTSLQTNFSGSGIDYRVTIFALGDDGVLTPSNTNDDMQTLANITCTSDYASNPSGWPDCQHRPVFNALVRDCPLYNSANNIYPNVRFLSFYASGANNIAATVNAFGVDDDFISLNGCTDNDLVSPGGRLENWGYATDMIINHYQWLPGYQRIVIPVSDEYAWCGGAVVDGSGLALSPAANEDNNTGTGSADILVNIVNDALNPTHRTYVSPTIIAGAANQSLAADIANTTGGRALTDTNNWYVDLVRVINAAFCDGNGDGVMDCSLPAS